MRAQVLISMAAMQSILAAQTGQRLGADAAATAIGAVRAATGPGEVRAAAQLLVTTFSLMLASGQRAGPFREAEEALRAALANASADDWALRSAVLTAIGAATAMRAAAADDEALRVISRQAIADAERLLPGAGADRPLVRRGQGPVHVGHRAGALPERRRIGAPGAPAGRHAPRPS